MIAETPTRCVILKPIRCQGQYILASLEIASAVQPPRGMCEHASATDVSTIAERPQYQRALPYIRKAVTKRKRHVG
jgi:hypothetical protein